VILYVGVKVMAVVVATIELDRAPPTYTLDLVPSYVTATWVHVDGEIAPLPLLKMVVPETEP
jgi:hypothetical protein